MTTASTETENHLRTKGSSTENHRAKVMAAIEKAIEDCDWIKARELIGRELQREPHNHWLLTRLSTTYYEEREYAEAAIIAQKALDEAPHCPLVLWDLAGALYMLRRYSDAIDLYSRIVGIGIEGLSYGEHREGKARGRGMYADSLYRLALCYRDIGAFDKALNSIRRGLRARGPGCLSIYPISQLRAAESLLTGVREASHRKTGGRRKRKERALALVASTGKRH
jgi:tetratricopeptide (TPR) repeat protein